MPYFSLMSALILFLGRAELSLSTPLVDSKSLKSEKLSIKDQFLTIYRNLRFRFFLGADRKILVLCFCYPAYQCCGALGVFITFSFKSFLLDFPKDALFTLQLITY